MGFSISDFGLEIADSYDEDIPVATENAFLWVAKSMRRICMSSNEELISGSHGECFSLRGLLLLSAHDELIRNSSWLPMFFLADFGIVN